MADTSSNSTITIKKGKRGAIQADTIGQVFTRTYTWTCANGTDEVNDTKVLGRSPAGCLLLGAYTKANAAATVGSGVQFGISANANGAGGSAAIAGVANNTNVNYTYNAAATATQVAGASLTSDGYLVATTIGANNVVAVTKTATLVFVSVDPESAPYSTFAV